MKSIILITILFLNSVAYINAAKYITNNKVCEVIGESDQYTNTNYLLNIFTTTQELVNEYHDIKVKLETSYNKKIENILSILDRFLETSKLEFTTNEYSNIIKNNLIKEQSRDNFITCIESSSCNDNLEHLNYYADRLLTVSNKQNLKNITIIYEQINVLNDFHFINHILYKNSKIISELHEEIIKFTLDNVDDITNFKNNNKCITQYITSIKETNEYLTKAINIL